MATRIVVTVAATLSLAATVTTAQTPSPARVASSDSPDRVVLVGCVAREGDGPFFLRALGPDMQPRRRSAGSNSAKGSTPVGSSGDMVVVKASAGSNSAKSSTPIPVSVGTNRPRTSAVMSAKGSVPIAARATSVVAYELDATPGQLSQWTEHVLEIAGRPAAVPAASPASPSLAAPRLKVEWVRVLPSMCTQ